MKKAILFLTLIIGFIMFPVIAFAQGTDPGVDLTDLNQYFISLAALVPLVIIVVSWIKKLIKMEGIVAQIVSWLISIGLCFAGWFLKIGLFADIATWWYILIYGFAVGLAANGFFKIEFIQTLLTLLGLIKPKPKLR